MVCENIEAILGETRLEIPVISFVGTSNSGKTTLLVEVVKQLKLRGYRVAVVKHSHHDFDIDQPGKDSWRFTQAGSNLVAISSPSKVALVEQVEVEPTLSQLAEQVKGKADILLVEGYKNGNNAKVLLKRREPDRQDLYLKEEPLLTISASPSVLGTLEFNDKDVGNLINLLVRLIDENREPKVSQVSDPVPSCSRNLKDRFEELLAESGAVHGHICPGQVLGVRMAIRGCLELGIYRPKEEAKRLVVYVEIDRCAADAIQVVTGCKLGKRTMKYVDYGKLV